MKSAESSAADVVSSGAPDRVTCAILIPAYDEAASIGNVVEACRAAGLGPVLVVDDGSRDDTAAVAKAAGADVLRLTENLGKGGAVEAGARALEDEVILLVDADLTGLRPEHLRELAAPVMSGQVDMSRGVFSGGRWRTTTAQRLTPQLNGQRALKRELLLQVPGLANSRYGIEVAITEFARRHGWRCLDVPLEGVSQVMKEEKRGLVTGFLARLRMYGDIVRTLLDRPR